MIPSFKSDPFHVPMACTIDCSPCTSQNGKPDSVYCFRKANYESIRDHLNNIDLISIVSGEHDVNAMTSKLYDAIHSTFRDFVPSTTIRPSNKPK